MTKEENEKCTEYAIKITNALAEIFNEESENFINPKELSKGSNLTHLIYVLANVVPTEIYNKLSKDDKDLLDFNYLANRLIFQYSHSED